jgi:ketosteroid isomerase-like protein
MGRAIDRGIGWSIVGMLAGAMLGVGGCVSERNERMAPTGDVEELAAVARVLDDFHDAASKADFQRYFSHWTERSVFLGTDARERWVGAEFEVFAKPYFDQGKGWIYVPRNRRIEFSPDLATAWFDELLMNQKLGTCRGSGVLERRGDGWKVMQYNLSIQVPNDLAEEFAGKIRALEEGKK